MSISFLSKSFWNTNNGSNSNTMATTTSTSFAVVASSVATLLVCYVIDRVKNNDRFLSILSLSGSNGTGTKKPVDAASTSSISTNNPTSTLSNRGMKAVGGMSVGNSMSYAQYFFSAFEDMIDIQTNTLGYIPLCVAENKLLTEILADRMNQAGTAETAFNEKQAYNYNSFLGLPICRDSISYFLYKHFYKPDLTNSGINGIIPSGGGGKKDPNHHHNNHSIEDALRYIKPDHICVSAGACAVLNNLFCVLADVNKGECCLLPAPYYAAFENDMSLLGGVIPYPMKNVSNPITGPTIQELDTIYAQAKADGYLPKFLLISNPNNPLGTIYPSQSILTMVQWSRSKNIHFIVDEIYALSTHHPVVKNANGELVNKFESIIQILDNDFGDNVHMVYALSKDFGASGLRFGILYSQNTLLMKGISLMNSFSAVSGPIQYMVSEILTDDPFLTMFLQISRQRIFYSYNICVEKLNEMVVPYVPAEAGIFVYVDFSSLLPKKTYHYERQLTELLFNVARIVFTPGEAQRDPAPGMYRICYAWVSPEVLLIAMERLSRLVAKIRRMDWEDLVSHNERITRNVLEGV